MNTKTAERLREYAETHIVYNNRTNIDRLLGCFDSFVENLKKKNVTKIQNMNRCFEIWQRGIVQS